VYASVYVEDADITGLAISVGFLVGILLLPSLKQVKLGEVELGTENIGLKNIELEALLIRHQIRTSEQLLLKQFPIPHIPHLKTKEVIKL
jgi:hypothetical protein